MSEERNINQDQRFDDLYRKSLGEMRVEPPARVWNKVSRLMLWKELVRLNFSNVPGYTWVIAATVAVIIGGATWWFASVDQEDMGTVTVRTKVMPGAGTPAAPASPQPISAVPASEPAAAPAAKPVPTAPANPVPVQVPTPAPAAAIAEQSVPEPVQTEPAPAIALEPMISLGSGLFPLSGAVTAEVLQPVPNPKPEINLPPDIRQPGNRLPSALSVGASITPDMVFYNNSSSYFKYDYSLDAGLQYDLGRFYIQSGVGASWSSDIGNYAVSANKQDSVGFYYSVVSFSEVPGEPGNMQYNTMMSTVYDTNQYIYDYSTQNTYTYLTIPLTIGYRPIVRPLWSLSVDAGGFWSGLLNSKEPDPVFYIPDGRVTSVENTTPARNKSSFGLMGSVRFEYLFARRFSLMIAPTFKYHLNAVDDKEIPGSTQPWSIGLRCGIWYRIDLTK